MKCQRTLKAEVKLEGKGLHTGKNINIKFLPAKKDVGIRVKRTDIEGEPEIAALADYVTFTNRGTMLKRGECQVITIEHALSALYSLGVDNCLIEVDAEEFPILDGSAKPYYEAIEKAGVKELENSEKDIFVVRKRYQFTDESTGATITLLPDDHYSVDVFVDYNSPIVGAQYANLEKIEDFGTDIADARTFVFVKEIEALLSQNLIKGGDLENAIVIYDKEMSQEMIDKLSETMNQPKVDAKELKIISKGGLKHPNELARHKLLDVVGDLSLIGKTIQGKVIAKYPGHHVNTSLAKLIRKEIKKQEVQAPVYDDRVPPVLDVKAIKNLLPHRWPFLMIDKIVKIDTRSLVGVKNVTINETLFMGHFPDEPVLPGVLLVEAMAQTGGILVLNQLENPETYSTYFLKIDNVKFRQKVVPGDTVIFKVSLLDDIRRGIATMKGYAFVGGVIVAEAEFMAQISKNAN